MPCELDQFAGCRIHAQQAEQAKIVPVLLMAADSLATVQDQLPALDLDAVSARSGHAGGESLSAATDAGVL